MQQFRLVVVKEMFRVQEAPADIPLCSLDYMIQENKLLDFRRCPKT